MTNEQGMDELEQQVLGWDHNSVCAPDRGLECTVCKNTEDGIGHWSTICSLLLINEAHCCSVLGSSDQVLEGGSPRSRTARWRPT
jgi:hypothetical protein